MNYEFSENLTLIVILNAVKDLALGSCKRLCEIFHYAQNDINTQAVLQMICFLRNEAISSGV